MDDKTLTAMVEMLDTLDVYLMANWDEHARKRLRARAKVLYDLLVLEQKARAKAAKARKAPSTPPATSDAP